MDVGRDWQSNSGIDQVSEVMADVSEVVMMAWSWLMLPATCASSGIMSKGLEREQVAAGVNW